MAFERKTNDEIAKMNRRERLKYDTDLQLAENLEDSDKGFAQTYSQADRTMLAKGLQRSSYGAASLGNVLKQREEARNKLRTDASALYAQGLTQIEQEEAEQARWQREYELQQEQLRLQQEQQALARQQAEWAQANWQAEFDAKQAAATPTTTTTPTTKPKTWLDLANEDQDKKNKSFLGKLGSSVSGSFNLFK